jgi:hypothetical protein
MEKKFIETPAGCAVLILLLSIIGLGLYTFIKSGSSAGGESDSAYRSRKRTECQQSGRPEMWCACLVYQQSGGPQPANCP